eukprot:CAMPEP_0114331028 /NCGR_PEP_ID=MMETSP0101-20121206/2136_1 /TAXON_ID=38822 ORGANISM="Pteridomonas danica, Strain PT" /NCGR_SAMPLE_ID=MMETSP0101 /ASSEMBLY_ACC=CAM_ASM_000211 /LENGTH=104 /DNA_ID=CAMNT_0001461219 /DNA_START=20 /DNA_END=334 /DNA_ORIENTATION=-
MASLFRGIRQTSAVAKQLRVTPKRSMGGPGGGDHFHVSPWHSVTGRVLGTIMWLWVMHRAKEDGPVLLGFVHPWDNHHGGHHGHHDDGEYKFEHQIGSTPTPLE